MLKILPKVKFFYLLKKENLVFIQQMKINFTLNPNYSKYPYLFLFAKK